MPVIWATQVLESLAKDGVPSRAEISNAGMVNFRAGISTRVKQIEERKRWAAINK
jgi:hypothetical protein